MNVLIYRDKASAIKAIAQDMATLIKTTPKANLGLPTGNTYKDVYETFLTLGAHQFKDIHTFNLDEYLGLDDDHPGCFKTYMTDHLFKHVNLPSHQQHFPPTQGDPKAYDALIHTLGGLDRLYMGLGQNGHIAFNEPGTSFESHTHHVTLTEDTRHANQGDFASLSDVPKKAVTMGIQTIMQAKTLWLVAFGEEKAEAVKAMLDGPITTEHPASILNTHPCVTIVLDQAAARLLREEDYGSEISSSSEGPRRGHRLTWF